MSVLSSSVKSKLQAAKNSAKERADKDTYDALIDMADAIEKLDKKIKDLEAKAR